jgi:hypothetical protein
VIREAGFGYLLSSFEVSRADFDLDDTERSGTHWIVDLEACDPDVVARITAIPEEAAKLRGRGLTLDEGIATLAAFVRGA